MEAILVTGGAGYIGSQTCKALARAGYTPVAVDNLSRGHEALVKWGPLEAVDVTDQPALEAVIARHRPTGVVHCAAYIAVGESVAAPALYYRNNVGGTLALLEAMRGGGVERIVFSSTCATYGTVHQVPIGEGESQRPESPYGRTKLAMEWLLRDYAAAYGLRYATVRYFNASGADPEGETGEWHEPETHLVPLAIQAAMGGPSLAVWGTDYDTPDGTCVRDYVHTADLAEAHVAALGHLAGGGADLEVNLGSGRGYSVREVIAAVEAVTERPVPLAEGPRRPGDLPRLVADITLAERTLGFQPRHSDLTTIVRTAYAWHQALQG